MRLRTVFAPAIRSSAARRLPLFDASIDLVIYFGDVPALRPARTAVLWAARERLS